MRTAARFIVEPKKLSTRSTLFLHIIELLNLLTKLITSVGLGKQGDRSSPSADLGKSSKQANVKSEDPSFLCKDRSSAIPVKISKNNSFLTRSYIKNVPNYTYLQHMYRLQYKLNKKTANLFAECTVPLLAENNQELAPLQAKR